MENIILPTVIKAGTYNSRLIYKNKFTSNPRKTTMFEIEIPLENSGVSFIDDTVSDINTNTIICVKPNQIRHTKLPFSCLYIHMTINGGLLYDKLTALPNFIKVIEPLYYLNLFKKIASCYARKNDMENIMLQSLLLKLIYSLCEETPNFKNLNYSSFTNKQIANKVIAYINDNLVENLSLETIAKQVSLSPNYLHNIFKKATGKTIRTYIEERRIDKSLNLLSTTNKSLTEIAVECGFSSQSYYSYVFKKRMNSTPREYVKKIFERYNL